MTYTPDDHHLKQVVESFPDDTHNIMSEVSGLPILINILHQHPSSQLKFPCFQKFLVALAKILLGDRPLVTPPLLSSLASTPRLSVTAAGAAVLSFFGGRVLLGLVEVMAGVALDEFFMFCPDGSANLFDLRSLQSLKEHLLGIVLLSQFYHFSQQLFKIRGLKRRRLLLFESRLSHPKK